MAAQEGPVEPALHLLVHSPTHIALAGLHIVEIGACAAGPLICWSSEGCGSQHLLRVRFPVSRCCGNTGSSWHRRGGGCGRVRSNTFREGCGLWKVYISAGSGGQVGQGCTALVSLLSNDTLQPTASALQTAQPAKGAAEGTAVIDKHVEGRLLFSEEVRLRSSTVVHVLSNWTTTAITATVAAALRAL